MRTTEYTGKDLRAIRNAAGVSIRAVAREAGWRDHGLLSQWETGLTRPRPAGVQRYLAAIERLVARRAVQREGET